MELDEILESDEIIKLTYLFLIEDYNALVYWFRVAKIDIID